MMKKAWLLLALCALLAAALAGCAKVTEERGMPGGAQPTAATAATAAPAATEAPTEAPLDIPEGEKGPDEPGLNG